VEDRVPTPGLGNIRRSVQIYDGIVCCVDRGPRESVLVDCIEARLVLECYSVSLLQWGDNTGWRFYGVKRNTV
jgi:hypothetical protein